MPVSVCRLASSKGDGAGSGSDAGDCEEEIEASKYKAGGKGAKVK